MIGDFCPNGLSGVPRGSVFFTEAENDCMSVQYQCFDPTNTAESVLTIAFGGMYQEVRFSFT